MRTNDELITELRAQAAIAEFVMLAVALPPDEIKSSPHEIKLGIRMVRSDLTDAEALDTLNDLVNQHGFPLGFLVFKNESYGLSVKAEPLAEYVNDPIPSELLRAICLGIGHEFLQRG